MGLLIMHILLVVLSILNAWRNKVKASKAMWSICAVLWGVLCVNDVIGLIK